MFCNHWNKVTGRCRIHLIEKSKILEFRSNKLQSGWTGRTANLSITILNNLTKTFGGRETGDMKLKK